MYCRVHNLPQSHKEQLDDRPQEQLNDRPLRVLLIVPEAAADHWESLLASRTCIQYRVRGAIKDAAAWQRIWRDISSWDQNGGVLLVEHRQLGELLDAGAGARAAEQVREALTHPDLMLLDTAAVVAGAGGKNAGAKLNGALATLEVGRVLIIPGGEAGAQCSRSPVLRIVYCS